MIKKPIENSYWVVPGKLLAGEYPRNKDDASSRTKINALLDAGIDVFIDLTEDNEGLSSYAPLLGDNAVHERFAIVDVSVPLTKELTGKILDTIDQHLVQGQKIYIHCWGGVGRTGVIVGCWLARHGTSSTAALEKLRELWKACPKSKLRSSPETSEQERYILDRKESERRPTIINLDIKNL